MNSRIHNQSFRSPKESIKSQALYELQEALKDNNNSKNNEEITQKEKPYMFKA